MIKGIEHVGMSVTDLDRSIRFYRDLLGMEMMLTEFFGGAEYDAILALKGASGRVALLKSGSLQLELFEFSDSRRETPDARYPVSRPGITHFCFEVDDVDLEYSRLLDQGVVFHCPPLVFGTMKATYGRDPDGNVFEMVANLNATRA